MAKETNVEKLNRQDGDLIFWKSQAYILAGMTDEVNLFFRKETLNIEKNIKMLDSIDRGIENTNNNLIRVIKKLWKIK